MTREIEKIITVLNSGGTILYPTDTIWGLGCDATNSSAVKSIFEIKEREPSKSMLVLVSSVKDIYNYSSYIPEIALQLMEISETPLTIIFPGGKNLAPELIAEDGSIGIRIPNEPFIKELLSRFKRPIVATSANKSNEKIPAGFNEIDKSILKSVDYVVKPAKSEKTENKPSAIIKFFTSGAFSIIRK